MASYCVWATQRRRINCCRLQKVVVIGNLQRGLFFISISTSLCHLLFPIKRIIFIENICISDNDQRPFFYLNRLNSCVHNLKLFPVICLLHVFIVICSVNKCYCDILDNLYVQDYWSAEFSLQYSWWCYIPWIEKRWNILQYFCTL